MEQLTTSVPSREKSMAADGVAMSGQAPHQPPGAHIPQHDGLVVAPAGEDVPLGREGEAVDVVVVAQQGAEAPAGSGAGLDGSSRARSSPLRPRLPRLFPVLPPGAAAAAYPRRGRARRLRGPTGG